MHNRWVPGDECTDRFRFEYPSGTGKPNDEAEDEVRTGARASPAAR